MREALLILRKDVDHLRWELGAYFLLIVARMAVDILLPRHSELVTVQLTLGALFVVASIGLMYESVRQERIVGDRQYWLTRPLAWHSILAAKALFLGLIVVVPAVVAGALALALNGIWPLPMFSVALGLVLLGAFVITVASVTRTTVQFVLTVVAYVLLTVLSTTVIVHLFGFEAGYWGRVQNLRRGAETAVSTLIFGAVLWLQYRRRATRISRGLFGLGVLVVVAGLPGWHAAFALIQKLDGPGPSGSVRMAFDFNRRAQYSPGGWSNPSGGEAVGLRIPLAITGLPQGTRLIGERVRTTIDAPGGRHWDSGWRVTDAIVERQNGGIGEHFITGGTNYWLEFNVERSFFDAARLEDTPVRVASTAAFAILSAPRVVRVPVPCTGYRVGPGEFCSVSIHSGEQLTVDCFSASQENLPDSVYWLTDGKHSEGGPMGTRVVALSAWSVASNTSALLNLGETRFDRPLVHDSLRMPAAILLETAKTAGYFERSVSVDGIRLGPYEVGRSNGRRPVW